MGEEYSTLIVNPNHGECNALLAFFSRAEEFRMLKPVHQIEEALRMLRSGCVDVLLLDAVWDETPDAFGLIQAIDGVLKKPPMLFITSEVYDDSFLCRFQDLGALYTFIKPLEPANVLRQVRQTIDVRAYMEPADYYQTNLGIASTEEMQQKEITRHIRAVGIPAHLKGYHFLRHSIYLMLLSETPTAISITKKIYPLVAEKFETKPMLVERSIRNAIEVAWIRGNEEAIYEYFGYTVDDNKGKPTNAEFISMIADRIRMSPTKRFT